MMRGRFRNARNSAAQRGQSAGSLVIRWYIHCLLFLSCLVMGLCPLYCSSHGQTDGRNSSFRDKPHWSFVFVRCTARPTDRRTDGNLASVISLARHLSLSVVLLDPRAKTFPWSDIYNLSLSVVLCSTTDRSLSRFPFFFVLADKRAKVKTESSFVFVACTARP